MAIILAKKTRRTAWLKLFAIAPVTLGMSALCLANHFVGFGLLCGAAGLYSIWDSVQFLKRSN